MPITAFETPYSNILCLIIVSLVPMQPFPFLCNGRNLFFRGVLRYTIAARPSGIFLKIFLLSLFTLSATSISPSSTFAPNFVAIVSSEANEYDISTFSTYQIRPFLVTISGKKSVFVPVFTSSFCLG